MSYKNFFDSDKVEVSKKAIATKIIDMIENLELNNTHLSARRWIWELIQNAKDISDDKVDIVVDIHDDKVEFAHNGKPFKAVHLLSLINQVSGKERNDSSTTGKFGTGFLTTHLLSKVVSVQSLIKEDNEQLKRFHITLDRSSKDIKELSNSIQKTLGQLDEIDSSPEVTYAPGEITTVFTYHLNSESSKEIAKIGYEDLLTCIDYVLILQPKVNKVTVNGQEIYAKETSDNTFESINGRIYEVYKNDEKYSYLKIDSGTTSLVIPLVKENDTYSIVRLNNSIPKIFCDFPCVGSENFSFPVVFNDPNLYLTEPRDGAYFTNKQNDDIVMNKRILENALQTLLLTLRFVADLQDKVQFKENLLYIPEFVNYKWLDEEYIMSNVVNRLMNESKNIKYIKVGTAYYSPLEVIIPRFDTELEISIAAKLLEAYNQKKIVSADDASRYFDILCIDDSFASIDDIIDFILKATSLSSLASCLNLDTDINKNNPVEFINTLLEFNSIDEEYADKINKLKIFPSLSGQFNLLSNLTSLIDVEPHIADIYITNLNQYYSGRDSIYLPISLRESSFIHNGMNLNKVSIYRISTVDFLELFFKNKTDNTVSSLVSMMSRSLVSLTPEKDSPLSDRHKHLFDIATCRTSLAPIYIENYPKEVIELCEYHILKNPLREIRETSYAIVNQVFEYIVKYNCPMNLKMNLQYIKNMADGNTPVKAIPASNLYMLEDVKPALFDILTTYDSSYLTKTINHNYKYIEELLYPSKLTASLITSEITSYVLKKIANPSEKDRELFQKLYEYLQLNYDVIDKEFPGLKDKMQFLCDEKVMKQNQELINFIKDMCVKNNISMSEAMELLKNFNPNAQKDNSINSLFNFNMGSFLNSNIDDICLLDDLIGGPNDYSISPEDMNYIRRIGAEGEKATFNMIVEEFELLGYEAISRDTNIITFAKDGNEYTIKLFADNQQGYDIIIRLNGKVIHYIEVKSTVKKNISRVALSQRQLAKASACYMSKEENYTLICVTNVEEIPKFTIVNNPFGQLFNNSIHVDATISLSSSDRSISKDAHTKLEY